MAWKIITVGFRWLLGLWLIWLCAQGLAGSMQQGYMGAAGKALFAFAVGILGVLCLAPDLAKAAARPFQRIIDSIYLPGAEASRPPLDYKLADHYRNTRKFDEAVIEYAKIVRYYPREVMAHVRLYQLLRDELRDEKAADRAHRRAERALRRCDGLAEFEALTG